MTGFEWIEPAPAEIEWHWDGRVKYTIDPRGFAIGLSGGPIIADFEGKPVEVDTDNPRELWNIVQPTTESWLNGDPAPSGVYWVPWWTTTGWSPWPSEFDTYEEAVAEVKYWLRAADKIIGTQPPVLEPMKDQALNGPPGARSKRIKAKFGHTVNGVNYAVEYRTVVADVQVVGGIPVTGHWFCDAMPTKHGSGTEGRKYPHFGTSFLELMASSVLLPSGKPWWPDWLDKNLLQKNKEFSDAKVWPWPEEQFNAIWRGKRIPAEEL